MPPVDGVNSSSHIAHFMAMSLVNKEGMMVILKIDKSVIIPFEFNTHSTKLSQIVNRRIAFI